MSSTQQASGNSARVSWKPSKSFGVPDFDEISGVNTTLAADVAPGSTSITVADATGAAAGNILRVGDDDTYQVLKIASNYVSGTTIGIDPATPIYYQLYSGDTVREIDPTGFQKLAAFATIDNVMSRGRFESGAITGQPMLEAIRSGNVDLTFNMTFELGTEGVGFLFYNALTNSYISEGTDKGGGVSTTLSGAVAAGDKQIVVTSGSGFADNQIYRLGSGATAEVIKVDPSYTSGTTIPLTKKLRFAHADTEAVVQLDETKPIKHTIVRGITQSPGLDILLAFKDVDSYAFLRGCTINSLSGTVTPDGSTKVTVGFIGKAGQILTADIFGTPADVSHDFYNPWEGRITLDGTVNKRITSFTFNITNNVEGASYIIGSPFRGSATMGDRRTGGTIEYQYFDQDIVSKTMLESDVVIQIKWTYIKDAKHSLLIKYPRGRFTGTVHPGVPGKGALKDSKTFDGLRDSGTNTDIHIEIESTEVTLQ